MQLRSHLGIESSDGSVATAHKALGSVAFALLLLQVGGAVHTCLQVIACCEILMRIYY
jgi:hypothetical protein